MSLYPIQEAHEQGYAENLYLDSATRTYIEETGGANVIFITKDNVVVTPKSDSILPSVTRRSLMYVAEHYLGLKVEERAIPFEEIANFKECALCGTAAVLSPVGRIDNKEQTIEFDYNNKGIGEISKKLYDTLVGIQIGLIEAPEGWIREIE
jgi:branched-chain amino acid aminotransferase